MSAGMLAFMNNPRIVFLGVDPEDQPIVSARYPQVVFLPAELRGEALAEACGGAQIISTFITTPFPASVLEKLPDLKLIATRSVGYDHIDIEWCVSHDVTVCNVPDYGSHVIAEHVFALLLGTMRHIVEGNRRVREGIFDYRGLRGMALQGKTIGIVGTGRIGRKVAKIAHGFGMKIVAVDVFKVQELTDEFGVQYVELPQLLAESDVITLHAPSLPETRHMINAGTIAQMKPGVVLVNTARGSLVDTDALIHGLDQGIIRYALLDVLEHEADLGKDGSLIHHPKVVTTPHIAFYADDSVKTMYLDSFASIEEWLAGTPPARAVKPVHVEPSAGVNVKN